MDVVDVRGTAAGCTPGAGGHRNAVEVERPNGIAAGEAQVQLGTHRHVDTRQIVQARIANTQDAAFDLRVAGVAGSPQVYPAERGASKPEKRKAS
jgi:hypothetical protein